MNNYVIISIVFFITCAVIKCDPTQILCSVAFSKWVFQFELCRLKIDKNKFVNTILLQMHKTTICNVSNNVRAFTRRAIVNWTYLRVRAGWTSGHISISLSPYLCHCSCPKLNLFWRQAHAPHNLRTHKVERSKSMDPVKGGRKLDLYCKNNAAVCWMGLQIWFIQKALVLTNYLKILPLFDLINPRLCRPANVRNTECVSNPNCTWKVSHWYR